MEGERRQVPRKSEGGDRRGSGSQITYFFLAHTSHSCLAKDSLTPPPSSHLFTLTTRFQLHPQAQPQSTYLAVRELYCLTVGPHCLQSKTQTPLAGDCTHTKHPPHCSSPLYHVHFHLGDFLLSPVLQLSLFPFRIPDLFWGKVLPQPLNGTPGPLWTPQVPLVVRLFLPLSTPNHHLLRIHPPRLMLVLIPPHPPGWPRRCSDSTWEGTGRLRSPGPEHQ